MSKLYQYSHFLAVSNGLYDGDLQIKELKKFGNYGLGTFNGLDGELVVINNTYYHCSKGVAKLADDTSLLAWAAVVDCNFDSKKYVVLDIRDIKHLEANLLKMVDTINYPYIFFIKGNCEAFTLGSVPKQSKPYPPIAEVIQDSITTNLKNIEVEIVGFYAPKFMYPIKSTGLHLHFISSDRNVGGHILDLKITRAEVTFNIITSFEIVLPLNSDYIKMSLEYPNNNEKALPIFADKLIVEDL